MRKTFLQIQDEVIARYGIKVNPDSCPFGCRTRTHAHTKERQVCKWKRDNTYAATFDLLHEVGHIENNTSSMKKRAEREYYATIWAIDRCKEYNITVRLSTLFIYQRYILSEIYRGIRRGGKNYGDFNIYKYVGKEVSLEDIYHQCTVNWQRYMDGYKEHKPIEL